MGKPLKARSGPWKGVWDTPTLERQDPALAFGSFNALLRDGAWWARPGHTRTAAQLGSAGTRVGRAACAVEVAGVWYNFAVIGDKLYRATDATSGTWTDVTPAGPDFTKATDLVAYSGSVIVTLSNNRPLVLTGLTGTPVTSTSIDLDSAGSTWWAYGPATVYAGRVFFILQNVAAGAYAGFYQDTIVWSEPATPLVGYRQTNFADFWQLTQSGQELLSAIRGTETALYYFRFNSIGVIYGKVDSQFVGEATQDSVSLTAGAANPRAVVQVSTDYLWFIDQIGQVWRMKIGGEPEPVWKAMAERRVDLQLQNDPAWISDVLNGAAITYDSRAAVVRCNLLAGAPSINGAASRAQEIFDAVTGAYMGRWVIGSTVPPAQLISGYTGCWIETASMLRDSHGAPVYCLFGTVGGTPTYTTGNSGYVWYEAWPFGSSSSASIVDSDAGTPMGYAVVVVTQLLIDSDDEVAQLDTLTIEYMGIPNGVAPTFYYAVGEPQSNRNYAAVTGAALPVADAVQLTHGRIVIGLGSDSQGRWLRVGVYRLTSSSDTKGDTAIERITVKGNVVPALTMIR